LGFVYLDFAIQNGSTGLESDCFWKWLLQKAGWQLEGFMQNSL